VGEVDKLTAEQAAYLAGAIDGEGSLAIQHKKAQQYRSPTFMFVARITNTNLPWLEGIQREIGGRIYSSNSKKRLNRRPCFVLSLRGGEARTMLVQVQPWLRIKQRHAEILLRYFDVAARRRTMNSVNQKTDPGVIAELDALYKEIKSINLRGLVQNWTVPPPKPRGKCQMDGCPHPHVGRGYCKSHYKKYIERGGPAWHERECVRCSKPFVAKRSDAVFCSDLCSNAAYKRLKRSSPSLS
jgi:hypothetical protein